MKKLFIVIAVLCIGMFCKGQILKDLSRRVANDAKSKAEQKISSKIDQGLDSLTKKKTKTKSKKNDTTSPVVSQLDSTKGSVQSSQGNKTSSTQMAQTTASTTSTVTQSNSSSNNSGNNSNPDPYSSDGSFITLKVFPTKVLIGNSVAITGKSVKYKNFTQVVMTITAENKVSQSKNIPMKDDGTFSTTWQPGGDGGYTIQVKSSDGKAMQSEDVSAYDFKEMDSVTQKPKEEMKRATDNLNNDIDAIMPMLSSKDASDLKKEMDKVKERENTYMQLLNDLDDAGKNFDALEKSSGPLPPAVVTNFERVTDTILQTADKMKEANDIANHKAYDNTICEYLVMVKEACAALFTITNFGTSSIVKILTNIALDKALPKAVSAADKKMDVGESNDMSNKECTKIVATAKFDASSLAEKLGVAGFAGDMIEMCSEHLLKEYCVDLSGDLTENYRCIVRNKNQTAWWDYSYSTSATISLRSPKNSISGGIMKMKGNIEGNATHFSIYQNVKEIDAFKDEMKGKSGFVTIFPICVYSPPFIPFSSTKADKNTGFGAVARTIVTPAYFNIPIDADYDLNNKKLTLYVNEAIADFGPQICYVYFYIATAAGLPLFTRVNYPINRVKLTLGKVISDNSTFTIGGSEEKPSIKGTGKTHLGDASTHIEQKIDFTFGLQSNE